MKKLNGFQKKAGVLKTGGKPLQGADRFRYLAMLAVVAVILAAIWWRLIP